MRSEPSALGKAWFQAQNPRELYSTAVTVAEIRYGISRLPDGERKEKLAEAADKVFSSFPDRISAFDLAAAAEYGATNGP